HFPSQRYSTDLYWLPSSRKSTVLSSFIVKESFTSYSPPVFCLHDAVAFRVLPLHALSLPNVHGPKFESAVLSVIVTRSFGVSLPSSLHACFCVQVPTSAASSCAAAGSALAPSPIRAMMKISTLRMVRSLSLRSLGARVTAQMRPVCGDAFSPSPLERRIDRHPVPMRQPVRLVGHADHGHQLAEHRLVHAGLAGGGAVARDAVAAAVADA